MEYPKCGDELRMMADITITMPSSLESQLSKKNFRQKSVRIYAANWSNAFYYCENPGCRWNSSFGRKEQLDASNKS